jgi:uncharacterized protein (TIGR03437 family)
MSWSAFGQTYTITTVAGTGTNSGGPFGVDGDNGPATSAQLFNPQGVAVDAAGNLYIADTLNHRIRKVSNGVITTVAGMWIGTGGSGVLLGGYSGDGGPATSAELNTPESIAVDSAGNLYIADAYNFRIREVSNGVITTVAGGGSAFPGDSGPATNAVLSYLEGIAVDSAGNLYIADTDNNRIRKVSNGVITTVAGSGTQGYSGDNGPAIGAQLNIPYGVAVDSAGNLYIADAHNNRIRKVSNGVITTVAGNGTQGYSGDNGPAVSAQLHTPNRVAVDSAGNLYIADTDNQRIRKVANGVITTVGGNGTCCFSGDGGPATGAQLAYPTGVAVDSAGNLYIADTQNNRIRVLAPVGSPCAYSVAPASLQAPAAGGNLTVSIQTGAACPWAVSNLPGWITVSGASSGAGSATVTLVVAPNSGSAMSATVSIAGVSVTVAQPAATAFCTYSASPTTLQAPAAGGNVTVSIQTTASCPWTVSNLPSWITVSGASSGAGSATVTLVVPPNSGSAMSATILIAGVSVTVTQPAAGPPPTTAYTIHTVAGNGGYGYSGDGGSATTAEVYHPAGVAMDPAGNLYIADTDNQRIRKVANGIITTVAGNGVLGFGGDNGPATSAQFWSPQGVAVDSAGNLYVADTNNSRIRRVSNGVITTVAGNGASGYTGDGGPAISAQLNQPMGGVAVDSAGNLYIADTDNDRVRKVSNGVITTFAGNGTYGFSGDGGLATSAQLFNPLGVAVDSAGNLYIADSDNNRVRKVSNGVITTVAGTGPTNWTSSVGTFGGDNGPATSAQLNYPEGVAVDSAGNIYIADIGNDRIRKVANGVITTVAGNGTLGYSGDNGPAISARLAQPYGVAVDSAGNIYIADAGNNRIRILTLSSSCTYSVSPTTLQAPASGGNLTISIQTTASCFWAVSGLPSWITVSGASSGTGSATVTLVVSPNNSGANLSATVLIAGASIPVTQAVALASVPTINAVVNAASYIGGSVSPGEMVTLFGTAIGPAAAAYATTDSATGKLATMIGGVQVLFNGIAAPMIYAGSTQVSAVVPYEMGPVASPSVWTKYAGQTSNAFQLNSATTMPGLFTQNASGSGLGAILNQDNSLNGTGNPAAKGSIVQVYLTGEGQTNPPSVTGTITAATLPPPQVTPAPQLPVGVTINGQPALYVYAGEAPGMVAGMMQLNVQIPSNAPSGNLPITVSIGGNMSQKGVTVSVH